MILAYQWLTLAAQANDSAAPALRDKLAAEMTGDQIGEAQSRLADWRPGSCVTEAKLK